MDTSAPQTGDPSELARLRSRVRERLAAPAPGNALRPRRIDPGQRPSRLNLSSAQRRLWYLDQQGASAAYKLSLTVRLRGRLDRLALRSSLGTIVERHEALRTVFLQIDGEPLQMIQPAAGFELREVDLRGQRRPVAEEQMEAICAAEARAAFALDSGPLFRGALVLLDDEDHVLCLSAHHIVFDGWSRAVLMRELATLYDAYSRGLANPLPPLPLQYADYALWQSSWLQCGAAEEHLRYWRRQLSGAPMVLELPTDRPRPQMQTYCGDSIDFGIDAQLTREIGAFARGHEATLFMVLQAALAVVLSRLCGSDDIVIGTPAANRRWEELEGSIGCFVNPLALRVQLHAGLTGVGLIDQVKSTILAAYRHQDLPFEKILESLQLGRSSSHSPVFQVLLSLQNTPRSALQLPGVTLEIRDVRNQTAMDLVVLLEEVEDCIVGSIHYSTDLFDRPTVERWAGYFSSLLLQLARNPGARLDELPLCARQAALGLSVSDHTQVAPAAGGTSIPLLFEAQVARTPDAIALTFEESQWTYACLNRKANQLAHHLQKRGVRANARVAVLMRRCADAVIAQLAILKMGSVHVPLDPDIPVQRQLAMLSDCSAAAVIAADGRQAQAAPTWIGIADAADAIAACPMTGLGVVAAEGSTACIMYTSGSTGTPKGVAVQHSAIINLCVNNEYITVAASDCIAHCSNPSFDASTFEVWTALLNGAQVAIIPHLTMLDPVEFARSLRELQVSVLWMTAPLFNQCVQTSAGMFDSVRCLLVGGDVVLPDTARHVCERGARQRLVNMYGPTEATTFAAWYEITSVAARTRSIPIGRPISNVSIYILRGELEPAPVGIVGEIYIGGSGLAQGYLDRPSLSAERFVPCPFGTTPGARMYATGDRARWRPDRNIEFLGRRDRQIKIRGFRVEAGEIEARLLEHPRVHEALVIAVEREPGERQLVAYVTAAADAHAGGASEGELREYLRTSLPEYMLPAAIVGLERLPLTSNGKIDRGALPEPDWSRRPECSYVAPRTELEHTLCDIWASVLARSRVGVTDDFFLLGGHSLLAVRLVNAIKVQLGHSVPLRRFLEAPTVEQLARSLAEPADAPDGGGEMLVPDAAAEHEPFPLTAVQLAYWIGRQGVAELSNVGAHAYAEIPLRGIDVACLEATLNKLIQRHAALRTIIRSDARQQVLAEVPHYRIRLQDLQTLAPQERSGRLAEVRAEMSHQLFGGGDWPLFDLRVSRLSASEAILHCSVDALVLDASSAIVLANEFIEAYSHPARVLPPLQLRFRDYVLARERFTKTRQYRDARAYWMTRAAGFPERPNLPLAMDPARIEQPRFERRSLRIAAPHWQVLTARARSHRVTPTVLLLSCFAEVLSRWCSQRRFALNLTLFNRIPFHPQVESLVGDFTTLILLELDYQDRSVQWLERLRSQQRRLWSDLEHRCFDGMEMARELRRLGGAAVSFPVVLTSTLGLTQGAKLAEQLATVAEGSRDTLIRGGIDGAGNFGISQTSQVWLDVQVFEEGESLRCNWDSVVGLFPQGMLDAMLAAFEDLLKRLTEDEAAWYRPADTMLPAAQAQLIESANATRAPVARSLLHAPLLRQAQLRADKIAVRTRSKALTYRELEERSRVLANRLLRSGAAPNQPIAIVMEKGWQQVVAALGILRAGAAYLPIDAGAPLERIGLLLQTGEARQIVTTPDFLERCSAHPGPVHLIEAASPVDTPELLQMPSSGVTPADLAYLIFTSGSTGTPKGVMIEHQAAHNTLADINRRHGVDHRDSILGLSSLSFDLSVYDIFGVLGAGGTLVLPEPEECRDPAAWLRHLAAGSEHQGLTLWNTVPALMRMLLDFQAGEGVALSLRLVLLSGDWIPLDLPERIRAVAPGAQLIALGGATEASIWSIAYPIQEVPSHWKSIPYGKPLANQTFHVLQNDLSSAPVWVAGDLFIGGCGLARGYWRDEQKTAESFILHPARGERLYKTGDRGRLWPDGNIEFLGRSDLQVKIFGHRIELGEIEAHLQAHPAVAEAVVVVREDRGDKRLLAYVVVSNGMPTESWDKQPLLDFLRAKLPGYMIPDRIVPLQVLPLTANGKIDRGSLARLSVDVRAAPQYAAPEGEMEESLAALWQELLQVERVGRHDDFFELGGHSLLAVQLVTRVRQKYGVHFTLREIFEYSDVQSMGECVDVLRWAGSSAPAAIPAADQGRDVIVL